MPNESFAKTVQAFIDEIRKQNGGTTFTDDPNAKDLCKLVYLGWPKLVMHGPRGLYNLFLKTTHMVDPEYRALKIMEHLERPWSLDVYWEKIFFPTLNAKSGRAGRTTDRSLTNNEIPELIKALEEIMLKENLIWFGPRFVEALTQIKKEGLVFQAECDRADEAMRRVEHMPT